jgi:3-hydroxyacyl-CoA dehydrogenase/enoyl-CoA hydratase/3-hydroxybutyryl-CoA epimerase
MSTYQHWRLDVDGDQILWLYFDRKEASVNTLNHEVMDELSQILDSLANDTKHKGLIIASAKENGFVAGADIAQFSQLKDIDEAVDLLRKGQTVFGKIYALKIPSVAMINGFCLGGGLELALACTYRVAEEGSKTRLGLPEVKLGIHPGWGGSVRLPRLIGAPQALELILSGRTVSAKAAAKIGFVDAAVPRRHLVRAAKSYVLSYQKPHRATYWQDLTNKRIIRPLLAFIMRKKLRQKTIPEHYPALFQIIDNWEQVGVVGHMPFEKEARSCGRLFFNQTSENLVRLFFLQDRLKGLAKDIKFSPQHVHVIGAGTMGGDIAAWCALQGMQVTLQDREAKFIAPAIKRAYQLFTERLKEPYLVQKAMDRLVPDIAGYGVPKADIIIEAIFEDLAVKQALFKAIESQAKPEAILATNTSSIPLDDINAALINPGRLVGIHFFNPVSKMQLIEIVKGKKTDALILNKAIAFARKIDRLPLPVKSSPGFLINRILMPYLLESMAMLDEGIPMTAVDQAMLNFGMPMGPITLADTVGLDICLSVACHLGKYFQSTVPPRLSMMVERAKLGKKSGEGFYKYTKSGKQIKPKEQEYNKSLTALADRLVLRMIDEAYACLNEGVVADADLLDAGMVFATGFAPFRGGPLHYAKTQDIQPMVEQT